MVQPMLIPSRFVPAGLTGLARDPTRLAPWVTALLVIALGIALTQLTWRILVPLADLPVAVPDRVDVSRFARGADRDTPGLERLAELHLFGRAPEDEQARAVPVEAPETRLRLDLKGVVALEAPGGGAALIAGEGEGERPYRVGDDLPGGATLEQILPDRVILSRDGRFEMLRLPRQRLGGQAVIPIPREEGTAGRDTGMAAELARKRDAWLEEPRRFMEVVRVRPVRRDGRLQGFAVSPRREAELFRRAGLRSGDVVTTVNGRSVASLGDPRALIKELSEASEVTLEVERGGRSLTLTLSMAP
ncbi:MAG: type II secretion system protein GspC [Ectothiorhodospira sp.]